MIFFLRSSILSRQSAQANELTDEVHLGCYQVVNSMPVVEVKGLFAAQLGCSEIGSGCDKLHPNCIYKLTKMKAL